MEDILVSVIMPSYNTPSDFLHEAVKSVLNQTYQNFELLIIDDGSATPVEETIGDIDDARIRVIKNDGNKGLPYTLNHGIDSAKGKYIFRMDSDDICTDNRIERQVEFMEKNPDTDVSASYARTFGEREVLCRLTDGQIKAGLLWKNELVHPTIVMRAETVKQNKIYYKQGAASEDYELWSRMAFENKCRFVVIPEILLRYRIHGKQVTKTNSQNLKRNEIDIIRRSLRTLKIDISEKQLLLYNKMRASEEMTKKEFFETISILGKILSQLPADMDRVYLKKVYRKQVVKYCLNKRLYLYIPKILAIR